MSFQSTLKDAITIRRFGNVAFETVPPTAAKAPALARLLTEEGVEALRRQIWASFDEAVGSAVFSAAMLGWSVIDATGTLCNTRLAQAVEILRANMKESDNGSK